MSAITVYAVFTILGVFLPLSQLIPWVLQHGLDLPLLFREIFSSRLGNYLGLDLILASLVAIAFVVIDGRRKRVPARWVPILATCVVGVSAGLPLYLWIREHARRRALAHPLRYESLR